MAKNDNFPKRIELALKKRLDRYASLGLTPEIISQPENIFKLKKDCKILLLRQDRIGDVLVSVPAIRALRNNFPDAKIDILFSRRNKGVSNAVKKYINKIWIYAPDIFSTWSLISAVKKEGYDLVVDMYDNASTTSSLLIKFFKIPMALGFDKENRTSYTHAIPPPDKKSVHIVERIANLLLPFGIHPGNVDLSLEYPISEDEKTKAQAKMGAKTKPVRLGINLSGSSKSKFWGKENYILFIKELLSRHNNVEVFIFTTLIFSGLAKDICKKSGAFLAPIANKIHEYALLLSTCDLILTPDTAAVHFAAAMNKPCLALYLWENKESPMPWFPYKSPYKALIAEGNNLSDINVEDAVLAFEELLHSGK